MLESLRRLALGAVLIALAAGVLLYTDRGSRKSSRSKSAPLHENGKVLRVALVQHASLDVLEQGIEGALAALAERGYVDGHRLEVRRFNAEGDIGTANAIAKEATSGGFDLILSVSTVSLQTIHNANRTGSRTRHVFGLVTDPYSAGVGIEATNHLIHPPYLAGAGSMQPVQRILRTTKLMRPDLKSVGLVWNAAEANSLAQARIARAMCEELGLTLIEANAENTTAVVEAANSVIARGAECIFLSGDITVSLATDQVLDACRRGRIPAFSALPPTVGRGSLFDMGANYVEIGRHVGGIAADVLDGKSTAEMSIDNFVPVMFLYNETVLGGLKEHWTIPDELRRGASGSITASSTNLPVLASGAKAQAPKPQPGRTYKVGLAYFAPESGADRCIEGILDGLQKLGFEEGKNLEMRRSHAQAEIANIPALLHNFDASDVDAILCMSTPVISGACGLVKRKPVVFTYCSDPIAAGAGKTFTEHLPFVTGIGSFPPVKDMVDAIRRTLPGAKSVGTIFNASEANSVKVISVAREFLAGAGLKLEEVTVASPSEVLQAAQALAGRKVDAIYIQGDNIVIQGFDAVVKAARDARLPLFVDDPECARRGAVACVGLGFYRPGYDLGKPLSRVLAGESPAGIPIVNVSEKVVWLDLPQAARLGIQFPADLIKAVAGQASPPVRGVVLTGSPARNYKVDIIEYIDTPNVEENREGIRAGLEQAGLKPGRDVELRVRNAQGDMAALSSMIDAAVSDQTDLLLVCCTPTLQAALRRAGNRNVVFALVANPIVAGAGKNDREHAPNVTGAYIPAPHAEGLAALRQCLPNVHRIGTLFVPAEVNSVFYKDELVKAARRGGLEVELVPVSSSSEIPDAAIALCGRNLDAVCQISDNLTGASFASVAQATQRARIPLMSFASAQARNGAFMAVSRDFYDGGVASGQIAARVLRGESPARIPFQLVETIKYLFNRAAASSASVAIPQELLRRGQVLN